VCTQTVPEAVLLLLLLSLLLLSLLLLLQVLGSESAMA
jgi:hypothetical protein